MMAARGALSDTHIDQVPVVMVQKLKDSFHSLAEYETECKTKVRAKDPLDLSFTMEEAASASKDTMQDAKLVHSMLASIMRSM